MNPRRKEVEVEVEVNTASDIIAGPFFIPSFLLTSEHVLVPRPRSSLYYTPYLSVCLCVVVRFTHNRYTFLHMWMVLSTGTEMFNQGNRIGIELYTIRTPPM